MFLFRTPCSRDTLSVTMDQQFTGRLEDRRFLTGQGRYTADIAAPGALHGYFLRSPHAHARILSIDAQAARALPGVVAVITGAELTAANVGPMPSVGEVKGRDGKRYVEPPRPVLAHERVLYAGELVALVLAETAALARDASEAILVDYASLPAVADGRAAVAPDAPQLWPQAPGNVALDWDKGNSQAVAAAFAGAAHVVKLESYNNRLVSNPIEARAAVAEYEPDSGRVSLHTPSQGVHMLHNLLTTRVLNWPSAALRVVTQDVGGGFGPKFYLYGEQAALAWAARQLRRSLRWECERAEAFLSDAHARDQHAVAELALDANGKFLALRVRAIANFGAYVSTFAPAIPLEGMGKVISGLYRIPAIHIAFRCMFTNTVPVDAYRGAGKPEALFLLERMIDMAAAKLGIERAELRRRNLLAPSALPYRTPMNHVYESGDYPRLLEALLQRADWAGFAARKAEAAARGKRRGIGLSCYLHGTGGIADELVTLSIDADGCVTCLTGTQSTGQGHETAFARIVARLLDIDIARVRIVQGDSARIARGGGTGGSSSTIISGNTLKLAADKVIERARLLAGHLLEAAPADLRLREGGFEIVGTDRRIALGEIAARALDGHSLPPDLRGRLEAQAEFADKIASFPTGVMAAEIEIDGDSGRLEIVKLTNLIDAGTVIEPKLVEGQMHGGIAQGIGQALLENCLYDRDSGQLLTGSFMDYGLPRADDLPWLDSATLDTPSTNNAMGIKGVGELGPNGAPQAIVNAAIDALADLGVSHLDMPLTPEKIWRAINRR